MRDRARAAAAALVALEGLALIASGIALVVAGLRPSAKHPGSTEALAVIAVAVGVGCALLGRALARGSRAARSPTVVLQVLLLPVAFSMLQAGRWYVGLPLGVVALAVLVLLVRSGMFSEQQ